MILSRFEDIREIARALNVEMDNVTLTEEWLQLSRTANPNGLNDVLG